MHFFLYLPLLCANAILERGVINIVFSLLSFFAQELSGRKNVFFFFLINVPSFYFLNRLGFCQKLFGYVIVSRAGKMCTVPAN